MPIEREKYTKHFVDEGLEIIKTVETLVFDIKDGVSVEDDLATLLRGLHTMKGSSRMLEYKRIEDLSHSLESVFVAVREQRIGLSENAVKLVLSSLDLLKTAFNGLFETKDDDVDVHEYVKNLTLLASNEEYSLVNINKDALDSPAKTSAVLKQEAAENAQPEKKRDSKHESIRLSLEKIDGIIKSIATLQTLEIQAKSIWQSSIALSAMIKEFSVVFKSTGKPDPVMLSDIRKFERSSERLGSALRNYAIDAGNSIRGAYDSVISLRTLPVSTIFDSYPRYIYQLSQELGKKVQLNVEGKENEIDKNIIESMSDVFLHMVRNALDHGLETPQERIASGKNETGNLSIICSRESGSMKIIISDDGRGLDHEKIRKKAVKEGFVSEVVASGLTKEDLTNFIFQSGFSTSKEVSGVSGRGVGMDVVRETVESLKGSIVVESAKGEGTIFTIMVPLSIAALMGFPVECSGMKL
ncbi:MAG: ATP-binding protein [Treponema sp.]|nr:ATP-binding protein [Treponema sp.]